MCARVKRGRIIRLFSNPFAHGLREAEKHTGVCSFVSMNTCVAGCGFLLGFGITVCGRDVSSAPWN